MVEKTGLNILEIQEKLPLEVRNRHMAAISVMEKAKAMKEPKKD